MEVVSDPARPQPHFELPHAETGSIPSITVVAAFPSFLIVLLAVEYFFIFDQARLRCLSMSAGQDPQTRV